MQAAPVSGTCNNFAEAKHGANINLLHLLQIRCFSYSWLFLRRTRWKKQRSERGRSKWSWLGEARREPNEVEALLAAHFAKSSLFGIAGAARRKAIRSIMEAAEKAWRWLWMLGYKSESGGWKTQNTQWWCVPVYLKSFPSFKGMQPEKRPFLGCVLKYLSSSVASQCSLKWKF